MKITKGQIIRQGQSEPFKFDQYVDVSELVGMNNDIINIDPVHVTGYCTIHGNEVTFTFNMEGIMILPCARTLIEVSYPYDIDVVEVFTSDPLKETEEIHLFDGVVLDLKPYIEENILLEIPFRVFSDDEEAISKVKTSGPGWQFIAEEKIEKKVDPRLQKLESFFKEKEDN